MSLTFRVAAGVLGVVILLFGIINMFVGSENLVLRGLFTASWVVMGIVLIRYATCRRAPRKQEN